MSPKCRPAIPVLVAASCVLVTGCMPSYYRLGSAADPYAYSPGVGAIPVTYISSAPPVPVRASPPPRHARVKAAQSRPAGPDLEREVSHTSSAVAAPARVEGRVAGQPAAQPVIINSAEQGAAQPPSRPSAYQQASSASARERPQSSDLAPQRQSLVTPAAIAPAQQEAASQPAIRPEVIPPVAQQLLDEGRAFFKDGEVVKARQRFNSAVSAPLGVVLLEVGRTYDAHYLTKLDHADVSADAAQARKLYEQAIKLGNHDAKAELDRVAAGESRTQ